MLCRFKQAPIRAEIHLMTTGSSPSPRFRAGRVSAPATPEEQLRLLLEEGRPLSEAVRELAGAALVRRDAPEAVRLAAVAGEAADPHRAYYAQVQVAQLLVDLSQRIPHDDTWAWAAPLDAVVEQLTPWLEAHPHEPELLNLLGLAVYELGSTRLARRLFETVREIEPEHMQARRNLRACRERMQRGSAVASVPEQHAPALARMHTRAKRIAGLATRLPERTVSLCMIVKDEEEMLPACLAAAAEWVDQVVVVDTGSSDRTREIALEHGAEVHEFPWTGSFADARNESLRHATGDWVLFLDADEHLVEGDGPLIRATARCEWLEGAYVVETHYTGEAELGSQSVHAPMRLFRRRPEYRWEGIVHEQLLYSFPTWLTDRFRHSGIRVDHYGYLKSVVDDRDKHTRNLTLLHEQLEHKRDAFTCFNIGTEYSGMGDWAQALPWNEEALTHARAEDERWWDQQFAPMLVARLVMSRRGVGDHAGALDLVAEALGFWPDFTDLVFERALVHLDRGEHADAAEQAARAVAMGDAPQRYVSTTGKGSYQARAVHAAALRELGDLGGALEQLELAFSQAPDFLPTILDLAETKLRLQPAEDVAQWFEERLGKHRHGASANMLLAAAFHESGAFTQAEACYDRVLEAHPGHGMALVAMAELRLAQRRYQEAWDLANSVADDDRMVSRGARTAFLTGVLLGFDDELPGVTERITASNSLHFDERAFYEAWLAALQPGRGAEAIVPTGPAAVEALTRNLEALARLEETEQFEALHGLASRVVPDARQLHTLLGQLYLRRRFADMAGEEFIACIERFGPDPTTLTGLGKVATIKELWDDAEVFLAESLVLEPNQPEASRLLGLIRERLAS